MPDQIPRLRARRSGPRIAAHAAAVLFCAAIAVKGARTTADLHWPYDPDQFRDIAHAQTIRDGEWFQDPFYLEERAWYNPLLPGTLALLSAALDTPVHIVATRAGAYLNVAAPLAFYALAVQLLGPAAALAALAGFLIAGDAPTWASATYTPWLFGSVFAQPLFYLTLLALGRAMVSDRRSAWMIAGAGLGATLLAHTAPALIAAAIVAAGGLRVAARTDRFAAGAVERLGLAAAPAVIVAAPLLATIVGYYQLRIVNVVPMRWIDPALPIDDWRPLLTMFAARPLLNAAIVAGVAAAALGSVRGRAAYILVTWALASSALFVYANYLVFALPGLPLIVPAHHFLLYQRAAEMMFFGLGVAAAARVAGWTVSRALPAAPRAEAIRTRATAAALAVLLTALAVHRYPAFASRDDYGRNRNISLDTFATPELAAIHPWLREHTKAADVVLTAESAALSIVGPAGRKAVVVPVFFSNPYVSWQLRKEAESAMWSTLSAGDCRAFHAHARAFSVTHVMTAAGRTPPIAADVCGLTATTFPGESISILRLPQR